MATARQLAREEIRKHLESQLQTAQANVHTNLYKFKRLTEEQEVLKRKVSELYAVIKHMEKL